MNSFISSFKPLLLAVVAIVSVEAAVQAVLRPSTVERSNYLYWMYARPESFHNLIIYQKLNTVVATHANVIQVGDSSGFHGVRPNVINQYLGNLRYINLSCCADIGFDGYYDIAKFALQRMSDPAAVVLYISLSNVPKNRLTNATPQIGGNRIHAVLFGPWSFLAFPTLALRPILTDIVYTLGGMIEPLRLGLSYRSRYDTFLSTIQRENGWLAEQDARHTEQWRAKYFSNTCGEPNPYKPVSSDMYTPDGQFLPSLIFGRFADLAAQFNSKLIIVVNPNPCLAVDVRDAQLLRSIIDKLNSDGKNILVYPSMFYEHWPRYSFVDYSHLRIGYDVDNSRRVGQFVADALGIAPLPSTAAQQPERRSPLDELNNIKIWEASRFDQGWGQTGITIANSEIPASGTLVTETTSFGRRYMEIGVDNLPADRDYLVSLRFKPKGDRIAHLLLRDGNPGKVGLAICNPKESQATRHNDSYDGDLVESEDGWLTCWQTVRLTQSRAIIVIDIVPHSGGFPYSGDGSSGLIIQKLELYQLPPRPANEW